MNINGNNTNKCHSPAKYCQSHNVHSHKIVLIIKDLNVANILHRIARKRGTVKK